MQPFIVRRPILTSVMAMLVLTICYGVSGTVLALAKVTEVSPVFPANLLLSLGAVLVLARTESFGLVFLKRGAKKSWLWLSLPLGLVLLVTAITSIASSGITVTSLANLTYLVVLAGSVGFVEEVVFRGILLRAWLTKGTPTAVVVSTLLFSLAHLAQLMGAQSASATVLQIVFSFALGLVLALVVIRTGSLWGAIAFHALFDFVQFISTSPSASVSSSSLSMIPVAGTVISTVILCGSVAWLAKRPVDGSSALTAIRFS